MFDRITNTVTYWLNEKICLWETDYRAAIYWEQQRKALWRK